MLKEGRREEAWGRNKDKGKRIAASGADTHLVHTQEETKTHCRVMLQVDDCEVATDRLKAMCKVITKIRDLCRDHYHITSHIKYRLGFATAKTFGKR